jgi:ferric-dicitrate binding protein FerR (iron transport regulator)
MTFESYLRYARRESSLEEARAMQTWLATPANALLVQKWMQQYGELLEKEVGGAEEMPDFEAVQQKVMTELGLGPAMSEKQRIAWWPRWLAAAVMLIGLMSGGAWFWQAHQAPAFTTVATAYGEVRTVRLPDGSTVKLNGHSTLRYAADLSPQNSREVWLDGEAFFGVQHTPNHQRFVVHTTAGFQVEVLGTTFMVYNRHAQAHVVLLKGKVRVDFTDSARSKEVVLRPGELLATTDAQPKRIEHKAVNTNLYSAWLNNRLVFDETSLADVATQLSDTYGVAVTVENPSLTRYKVTGTFPIGDPEAVLQFLEKSFPLTVQRRPNQFVISDHSSSSQ